MNLVGKNQISQPYKEPTPQIKFGKVFLRIVQQDILRIVQQDILRIVQQDIYALCSKTFTHCAASLKTPLFYSDRPKPDPRDVP